MVETHPTSTPDVFSYPAIVYLMKGEKWAVITNFVSLQGFLLL